jgi:hypothetical protein
MRGLPQCTTLLYHCEHRGIGSPSSMTVPIRRRERQDPFREADSTYRSPIHTYTRYHVNVRLPTNAYPLFCCLGGCSGSALLLHNPTLLIVWPKNRTLIIMGSSHFYCMRKRVTQPEIRPFIRRETPTPPGQTHVVGYDFTLPSAL